MAFREVRVFEVREVLRLFLRGEGLRSTERLVAGTARRSAAISAPPVSSVWSETAVRSYSLMRSWGWWWTRCAHAVVTGGVRRGRCWSPSTS